MSTQKKRAKLPLKPTDKANPGLLDAIFASATEYAIITTDPKGSIVSWNKGAELVFGYAPDEIVGKPLALIFTSEDNADGVPMRELTYARDIGRSDDVRWHRRKDGSVFWADGVMTPIRDFNGEITGYLKILRDETERRRAEAERAQMARIDLLTGVGNRSELEERLSEMSAAALRNGNLLLIHMMDLNNFKQINDRWGHQAGDRLLQQVARSIREAIRDSDFVARLGGDEFVVLQANVQTPATGASLAIKLIETLSNPIQIDGHEVVIGVSIGIAVFPDDAGDHDELMRKADLALYKVKNERSHGGYHYYSKQLDAEAHNKAQLIASLKRAVKARAFRLHYQPQVDARSGNIVAVEALLRCQDAALANRPVEEIIALAIDSGQMLELSLWVLTEACAQFGKWQAQGLTDFKMCINLCPRELLYAELSEHIERILRENKLDGEDIEIEITENQAVESDGPGSTMLARLRSLGVTIAIDDFGTGYSSLSKLRGLPVDKVKLDRSFLERIPADQDSCAVVSAIITLAHTLRLKIIVEGVESPEQVSFFRREGCEILQGNFFSKPLPAEAISRLLKFPVQD
ncbi:putative bifunctional diguanylate cyclase/phosphodiesterase [Duganella vulcania]|uniref:EAL domain-containing protein n=1 Tax=Duganella vulcania TaxID=2692166 RepID=A0A845GQZ9_9BURK|nr:bifunctional diguanylate cyclase/phosphodiesterase [Duganella vulcania]MYM96953.1 EAL domain-containing protein [Duganella vulcania]